MPSMQNRRRHREDDLGILEMVAEMKMLFWTLFDRRYHMAWLTRFITLGLLVMLFMIRISGFRWRRIDNILSRVLGQVRQPVRGFLFCSRSCSVESVVTRRIPR